MLFVTSWDDGHPCDLRIGRLLDRHGHRGTFFVPGSNSEGRPVLDRASRRALDIDFELGSHTLDHIYLSDLPRAAASSQIEEGKVRLEYELGHAVEGFCYPGGKLDQVIAKQVRQAGFAYARTTENLRTDPGNDRFRMPTTFQFFPHGRAVLTRNLLRHGRLQHRTANWRQALTERDWLTRLRGLALACQARQGVFHLWGHSWEIEQLGLWRELDEFLGWMAALRPEAATVGELARRIAMPAAR